MQIVELHFDSIDSTQSYAKREVDTFAADQMTCIIAEEQTKGHGRLQRTWVSPKGVNLYVTFCFRLPITTKHLGSLAIVMAYSLSSLLLKEKLHPKIKWPNDIQIGGKKVAGVLAETVFHKNSVQIFLGIGINVNMGKEDLDRIDQPATSLKKETHRSWDRSSFLKQLEERFLQDLDRFQKGGFTSFHQAVDALLAYRGEKVRCFDGKQTWEGICESLGEDGRLNLRLENGTLQQLFAGDITK